MRVGRYEVLAEIGQGGNGRVFRAQGPGGIVVALKLLFRRDAAVLARFERERRLQSVLGLEEGFVPVLDAGEAPEGAYLVMPFVEGGTLRERLKRGPFEIEDARALVFALARAMGRAHARGIVHRDLKPENVLFDAAGKPFISDLGLAKHFDPGALGASRSAALTHSAQWLGTAGYAPPEQMADAASVGAAADVFSLGAILHECLAGAPAFVGATTLEVASRVADGAHESVHEARPETPAWLVAVVERALAPDPARRFPDAVTLARALEPPMGRTRRPLLVLVLVLVLGATGVALLTSGAKNPLRVPVPPPQTAPPPAAPTPDAEAIALCDDAERALERREPVGALVNLDRAIALAPKLARAWTERALARSLLNQAEGAEADAREALRLDPAQTEAWFHLGFAHQRRREAAEALEAYARVLALDPDHAQALINRGGLLVNLGRAKEALVDLERAVQLRPEYPLLWLNLGIARDTLNQHEWARLDLTRAIELDPTAFKPWANRANANLALGHREDAIADASKAIEIDARVPEPWIIRGMARSPSDPKAAIADLEHFLELAPDHHGAADARRELEKLKVTR